MAHRTQYRFYYKKYSSPPDEAPIDLEVLHFCDYMRFTNLNPRGDVQNAYEETFAEKSGCNVFVPDIDDLAFKPYECELKLMFRGEGALNIARYFESKLQGEKIEYHDTFRNMYATLLMTKAMKIEAECLYGDNQYVVATFTFTNILGYTYTTSKLQSE